MESGVKELLAKPMTGCEVHYQLHHVEVTSVAILVRCSTLGGMRGVSVNPSCYSSMTKDAGRGTTRGHVNPAKLSKPATDRD